ncbi:dachshund homolog 2 isoform X2 [Octopus bimaculoides]|nr:dachshund homolog 2 isoform X2 [Octopus bimaculoides]
MLVNSVVTAVSAAAAAAAAAAGATGVCKLTKPSTYSSPPPIANNPENNVCKLIEYRGAKVAAFMVNGIELICLPQAFDLFLKHLVGGLHTVYTKLKRLDITPVVCNVEQVRILRGLGAIQPGVNRCKLLSCKEFDILYEDCTNSSARPGRPPKRSPSIHASPETLEKLKKSRLDGNEYQYDPRIYVVGKEYERILADEFKIFGYPSTIAGERKNILNGYPHHPYALGALPYMPLNHPIMSPPVSMTMANHLTMRPEAPIMKERSSSESDVLSPKSSDDRSEGGMKITDKVSHHMVDKSYPSLSHSDLSHKPLNLQINGHVRDLSKTAPKQDYDDDDDNDDKDSDDDKDDEDSADTNDSLPNGDMTDKIPTSSQSFASQLLNGDTPSISSIETLLLNIQGLLKVAAENARHHERQINFEKAELKMELLRERDLRENMEKQLLDEQRTRVMLQKRLKKEKKTRRKMQEQMDMIEQRNNMMSGERMSTPPGENIINTNDCHSQDMERERSYMEAAERKLQDSQERTPHLYETYMTHAGSPGATRFAYHPLVKNDVQ